MPMLTRCAFVLPPTVWGLGIDAATAHCQVAGDRDFILVNYMTSEINDGFAVNRIVIRVELPPRCISPLIYTPVRIIS